MVGNDAKQDYYTNCIHVAVVSLGPKKEPKWAPLDAKKTEWIQLAL